MTQRGMLVGCWLVAGVLGCGGSSGENAPVAAPSAATAPMPSAEANGGGAAAGAMSESGSGASSAGDGGVAGSSPALAPSAATPSQSAAVSGGEADKSTAKPARDAIAKGGHTAASEGDATKAAKPPRPAAATGTSEAKTASAPHAYDCGEKGQKPCPLQGWMKANMASAAASGDAAELAKQFDYVAAHAPAGLTNWASIAKAGAAKAKASDLDGAKAACKSCHDQYKAKYKVELRDRPF